MWLVMEGLGICAELVVGASPAGLMAWGKYCGLWRVGRIFLSTGWVAVGGVGWKRGVWRRGVEAVLLGDSWRCGFRGWLRRTVGRVGRALGPVCGRIRGL